MITYTSLSSKNIPLSSHTSLIDIPLSSQTSPYRHRHLLVDTNIEHYQWWREFTRWNMLLSTCDIHKAYQVKHKYPRKTVSQYAWSGQMLSHINLPTTYTCTFTHLEECPKAQPHLISTMSNIIVDTHCFHWNHQRQIQDWEIKSRCQQSQPNWFPTHFPYNLIIWSYHWGLMSLKSTKISKKYTTVLMAAVLTST